MVIDIFNTDRRYNIIYADPPWKYKAWNGKGKGKKRLKITMIVWS